MSGTTIGNYLLPHMVSTTYSIYASQDLAKFLGRNSRFPFTVPVEAPAFPGASKGYPCRLRSSAQKCVARAPACEGHRGSRWIDSSTRLPNDSRHDPSHREGASAGPNFAALLELMSTLVDCVVTLASHLLFVSPAMPPATAFIHSTLAQLSDDSRPFVLPLLRKAQPRAAMTTLPFGMPVMLSRAPGVFHPISVPPSPAPPTRLAVPPRRSAGYTQQYSRFTKQNA